MINKCTPNGSNFIKRLMMSSSRSKASCGQKFNWRVETPAQPLTTKTRTITTQSRLNPKTSRDQSSRQFLNRVDLGSSPSLLNPKLLNQLQLCQISDSRRSPMLSLQPWATTEQRIRTRISRRRALIRNQLEKSPRLFWSQFIQTVSVLMLI